MAKKNYPYDATITVQSDFIEGNPPFRSLPPGTRVTVTGPPDALGIVVVIVRDGTNDVGGVLAANIAPPPPP